MVSDTLHTQTAVKTVALRPIIILHFTASHSACRDETLVEVVRDQRATVQAKYCTR